MPESALNLLLCYGSLADPRLLEEGRRGCLRAAIVSPEDTFISVGGGTALAIARAAGYQSIVHDVAKLAPIPLGDVAITSAGKLPVEYVFHGASVEIGGDNIDWSEGSISNTMKSALAKCVALGIDVLFTPLLAAGAGRAPATVSIACILRAVSEFCRSVDLRGKEFQPLKVIIVVYQESELPRHEFERQFETAFENAA
jgi:O-acetyl-ADP-ribose deacetylase